MICLLQLEGKVSAREPTKTMAASINILSAWVETSWLGHLVTELPLGAQVPDHSSDAKDADTENGRVGLPVGRLGVPTTGRRPDVLGIPVCRGRSR